MGCFFYARLFEVLSDDSEQWRFNGEQILSSETAGNDEKPCGGLIGPTRGFGLGFAYCRY